MEDFPTTSRLNFSVLLSIQLNNLFSVLTRPPQHTNDVSILVHKDHKRIEGTKPVKTEL
jgi:hypothetical protein